MHRLFVVGLVSCVACVSPPEVKQTSSELTVTLASLSAAQSAFGRVLKAEPDSTRADLEAAIVARSVKYRIEELSTGEQNGSLIAISEAIEGTQTAARSVIKDLREAIPKLRMAKPGPSDLLEEFKKRRPRQYAEAADLIEADDPDGAQEIRAKSVLVVSHRTAVTQPAPRSPLVQVIERARTRPTLGTEIQCKERLGGLLRYYRRAA